MMRNILYFGNSLVNKGRTPTGIDTLSRQLRELGFEVKTAGTKWNKISRMLEMVRVLHQQRKWANYVLIDTYSTSAFWFAFILGILCKYIYRMQYVPILRGGNLPERIKNSKKYSDILFRNAYMNVAISGYMKHVFDQYGYSNKLINNNIDVKKYTFTRRETFGPKLLWVRSFQKDYNPRMAVQVLYNVLQAYPEAELCMIGPDKDGSMEMTKQSAVKLNIGHRLNIPGFLTKEEWHDLSKCYDIFINTTNFDNTPISVIEAMALGMPVVTTNAGGIPYLFNDKHDALLVEKNDAVQMSNYISELIKNPVLGYRLVNNARATINAYDWNTVQILWKELLK